MKDMQRNAEIVRKAKNKRAEIVQRSQKLLKVQIFQRKQRLPGM